MNRGSQRVHWLQHAEHEELGCIGPWLQQRGHRVTHTRLHEGERLPKAAAFDWLIVMGGPMNIYDEKTHPWLAAEKDLINDACVIDKKTLGICLGGQLLAHVLGARITKNGETEIGFFYVSLTEEGSKSWHLADFPPTFPAFHWHEDTFSIPHGCQNLLKSDACVNQAFTKGERLVAFQFHMEVRPDDARRWLSEPPQPQRYVQSAQEILRDPARFELNNQLMIRVLERMDTV